MDSESRRRAADVVEKFRDGLITNFDFEGMWPGPSFGERDRGLDAICRTMWHFYDDLSEHTLTGPHKLTEQGRAVVDRCVLFLRTELEYAWLEEDFIQAEACYGSYGSTFLGLSDAADRAEEDRLMRLHASGDDPSWPFANHTEYEAAKS